MNLQEFALDFLDNAMITVEADDTSLEDVVTTDILDYIKDSGEVLEPELCHFKQRGIKINAYDYDDDNNALDLFITIVKSEKKLTKVSDKDVLDAFSKAHNFFKASRNEKLTDKIDESNDKAFELSQIIQQTGKSLENLRIFVLTNGTASPEIIPSAREEEGILVDFQLWDIGRVHQQYLIRSGKQKIEIDFVNDYNHRLNCLRMDDVSDKVDVYLAIMPASILAAIYGKYRQGLLEKNVRTFLQFKVKVNQGIRKTIQDEPDMFFAYNNGISTTAEKVDIIYEDNIPYITGIKHWQIVNGGQTTASIYTTSTDKNIGLSKVFVQMKISVVKKKNDTENIVPNISKFANSQTAIKDSDFSSNHPYHIALETLSRTEWVPSKTGGRATNKWFYERTRGQYLDVQSEKSGRDLKAFKIEFPKQQKFSKTDLAKYEMSWWQRPHDVGKGAEKNFNFFTKEIENIGGDLSKTYYYRLIAKAILFKTIDRQVFKRQLGGYKANMVSYIMALLSYKSNKKLDLDSIWEAQAISEPMSEAIESMIDVVWKHINNPSKPGMNIGEWCKKAECWFSLKDKAVKGLDIEGISKENGDYQELNLLGKELSPVEVKIIDEAQAIAPQIWFGISKWAKDMNKFTAFDRKLAYNLGVLANRKSGLSIKQAKNALRILKAAQEEGFRD